MSERERVRLSPTQWRILARVAAGESNAAIAAALGLETQQVGNHLTRIARQLPREPAVARRAALAAWYLGEGRAYHGEVET